VVFFSSKYCAREPVPKIGGLHFCALLHGQISALLAANGSTQAGKRPQPVWSEGGSTACVGSDEVARCQKCGGPDR
jgi:hypothetical protein